MLGNYFNNSLFPVRLHYFSTSTYPREFSMFLYPFFSPWNFRTFKEWCIARWGSLLGGGFTGEKRPKTPGAYGKLDIIRRSQLIRRMARLETFCGTWRGIASRNYECSCPTTTTSSGSSLSLLLHVAHFLLEQIHFATPFLCWRVLVAMRHPRIYVCTYVSAMEMRNRYRDESSSRLLRLRLLLTATPFTRN